MIPSWIIIGNNQFQPSERTEESAERQHQRVWLQTELCLTLAKVHVSYVKQKTLQTASTSTSITNLNRHIVLIESCNLLTKEQNDLHMQQLALLEGMSQLEKVKDQTGILLSTIERADGQAPDPTFFTSLSLLEATIHLEFLKFITDETSGAVDLCRSCVEDATAAHFQSLVAHIGGDTAKAVEEISHAENAAQSASEVTVNVFLSTTEFNPSVGIPQIRVESKIDDQLAERIRAGVMPYAFTNEKVVKVKELIEIKAKVDDFVSQAYSKSLKAQIIGDHLMDGRDAVFSKKEAVQIALKCEKEAQRCHASAVTCGVVAYQIVVSRMSKYLKLFNRYETDTDVLAESTLQTVQVAMDAEILLTNNSIEISKLVLKMRQAARSIIDETPDGFAATVEVADLALQVAEQLESSLPAELDSEETTNSIETRINLTGEVQGAEMHAIQLCAESAWEKAEQITKISNQINYWMNLAPTEAEMLQATVSSVSAKYYFESNEVLKATQHSLLTSLAAHRAAHAILQSKEYRSIGSQFNFSEMANQVVAFASKCRDKAYAIEENVLIVQLDFTEKMALYTKTVAFLAKEFVLSAQEMLPNMPEPYRAHLENKVESASLAAHQAWLDAQLVQGVSFDTKQSVMLSQRVSSALEIVSDCGKEIVQWGKECLPYESLQSLHAQSIEVHFNRGELEKATNGHEDHELKVTGAVRDVVESALECWEQCKTLRQVYARMLVLGHCPTVDIEHTQDHIANVKLVLESEKSAEQFAEQDAEDVINALMLKATQSEGDHSMNFEDDAVARLKRELALERRKNEEFQREVERLKLGQNGHITKAEVTSESVNRNELLNGFNPAVDERHIVNLSIECRNLLQMDWVSPLNPMVALYRRDYSQEVYFLCDQTEIIKDSLMPKFSKQFRLKYSPGQTYMLRLYGVTDNELEDVIQEDDLIGSACLDVDDLLFNVQQGAATFMGILNMEEPLLTRQLETAGAGFFIAYTFESEPRTQKLELRLSLSQDDGERLDVVPVVAVFVRTPSNRNWELIKTFQSSFNFDQEIPENYETFLLDYDHLNKPTLKISVYHSDEPVSAVTKLGMCIVDIKDLYQSCGVSKCYDIGAGLGVTLASFDVTSTLGVDTSQVLESVPNPRAPSREVPDTPDVVGPGIENMHEKLKKMMTYGRRFRRYFLDGYSEKIALFYRENSPGPRICWCFETNRNECRTRTMRLRDIEHIVVGKQCHTLDLSHARINELTDDRAMSIFSRDNVLHLETKDETQRDAWIFGLTTLCSGQITTWPLHVWKVPFQPKRELPEERDVCMVNNSISPSSSNLDYDTSRSMTPHSSIDDRNKTPPNKAFAMSNLGTPSPRLQLGSPANDQPQKMEMFINVACRNLGNKFGQAISSFSVCVWSRSNEKMWRYMTRTDIGEGPSPKFRKQLDIDLAGTRELKFTVHELQDSVLHMKNVVGDRTIISQDLWNGKNGTSVEGASHACRIVHKLRSRLPQQRQENGAPERPELELICMRKQPQQDQQLEQIKEMMKRGRGFTFYQINRPPEQRFIFLVPSSGQGAPGTLYWQHLPKDNRIMLPDQSLDLSMLKDIYRGTSMPAFQGSYTWAKSPTIRSSCCFSLVCSNGQRFDLEASNKKQRDTWAYGLKKMMKRLDLTCNFHKER